MQVIKLQQKHYIFTELPFVVILQAQLIIVAIIMKLISHYLKIPHILLEVNPLSPIAIGDYNQ